MKIINFIWLVMGLIVLQGCATTTHLSAENRQMLHTITLDQNIKLPKEIYVLTNSQNNTIVMGGLIGSVIAAAEREDEAKQLDKFATTYQIRMDEMVRKELISQLKQSKQYQYQPKEPADAVLVVEIKTYGLTIAHSFTSEMIPVLHMQGKLIKNGKVIWQATVNSLMLNSEDLPRHKYDDIILKPNYLTEMWNAVTVKMVNKLLAQMN